MSTQRPRRKAARKNAAKRPATKNVARIQKKSGFTGYGDYKPIRKNRKEKSIGSKIGGAIGSGLGAGAEHFVRWLTGLGDYEVNENVLLSQDPPPMYNESNKGGTLIRHREYLKDIISSATPNSFNLESFLINPANEKTFPFLHQCAMNYEQYSIEGMIFEFRSMSADALNSTNTALGQVIMATNYDALDANFKQKSEMENYEFGNSCKPSASMMHPIECAPRQTTLTELYTLNGPAPAGADARFYHWGNFQIATNGCQGASVNLGELWISYQIRLLKPKLFTALGLEIGSASARNSSYTNALPLGNGIAQIFADTIGMFIDAPNRNIGFPVKGVRCHYLVLIRWTGTLTAVTYPLLTFTSCTQTNFTLPGTGIIGPAGGESCTAMSQCFSLITDANILGVVTIGNLGILPAAGTSVEIRIAELNPFNN